MLGSLSLVCSEGNTPAEVVADMENVGSHYLLIYLIHQSVVTAQSGHIGTEEAGVQCSCVTAWAWEEDDCLYLQ